MNKEEKNALSTQEVADMLNVSKSTIYDLIKKGAIRSYKVGRKVRFTEQDVMDYIEGHKTGNQNLGNTHVHLEMPQLKTLTQTIGKSNNPRGFIIAGQDGILDLLSGYMRNMDLPVLRSYLGSYDSLISLYKGEVDVAAVHLWDSDTDSYNLSYVRRLLPGVPATLIHVAKRTQGFYVPIGNPKGISGWQDFIRPDITMINREPGAGSRVLLDENLVNLNISSTSIKGYDNVTDSPLAVVAAVAEGNADIGIGSENNSARTGKVDFIPVQQERYEIAVKNSDLNKAEVAAIIEILNSEKFRTEISYIKGYDLAEMGRIVSGK